MLTLRSSSLLSTRIAFMLGQDPSYLWSAVASRRIQTPSLLQTLSWISVSCARKTLDVDIGKEPVGVY